MSKIIRALKMLVLAAMSSLLFSYTFAEEVTKFEIVYLPHGPVFKVVRDIEAIVADYPGSIVSKWSFDDKAGIELAKSYGFTGHLPILIIINESYRHEIAGNEVEFYNFPSNNSFSPLFKGAWSYEDLNLLLNQLANR